MCSKDKRCIVGDRFIATLEELISPSLPSTSQAYGQCFSRCFALDHITKFINMYFFFRYVREARDWSTKLFFFHRSFPLVKPCNRVPVPHLILDASNKIKKIPVVNFCIENYLFIICEASLFRYLTWVEDADTHVILYYCSISSKLEKTATFFLVPHTELSCSIQRWIGANTCSSGCVLLSQ